MKITMQMTGYELDENVDNLIIDFGFKVNESTGYGEFPYLKSSNTLVRYHKGVKTGTYYDVDIVEPQSFMEDSRYDDFEVNGYNIKKLIREFSKGELNQTT